VLGGTYLAGKMPAPQEFHDSILYLISAENSVVMLVTAPLSSVPVEVYIP